MVKNDPRMPTTVARCAKQGRADRHPRAAMERVCLILFLRLVEPALHRVLGSVETGWSRQTQRIISGMMAPPILCPRLSYRGPAWRGVRISCSDSISHLTFDASSAVDRLHIRRGISCTC